MSEDSSLSHLRVLAHPLRMRILSLLTGVAMSAAEVARELDDTQANVSYHLRRLHAVGLLDVAEQVSIRGGQAIRYRHDPNSGRRLVSRDPEEQRLLSVAIANELLRRSEYRRPGSKASMTDAEVWVDKATWDRALSLAHELSAMLHAKAQPPRSPGTRRVSTTISLFELR